MSNDNVVYFTGNTSLDIDPDRVLKHHIGELDSVLILGVNKNGEHVYASSSANAEKIVFELERCKKFILETLDD